MKILIVGAGALGGYFGGRLLEAGHDVTFLLRENRIAQLKTSQGLHIKSTYGDAHLGDFKYLTSEEIQDTYDLILVSCKAYSLNECMDSFAAAVGKNSLILPVLNGMGHISSLSARFGKQQVLGGVALISATLDETGRIFHLNKNHTLTFGELTGKQTDRVAQIQQAFSKANFISECSSDIMQAMWNKWVMIATAVGTTCLFRCAIGDAVKAGANSYITALFKECTAIARENGFALAEDVYKKTLSNMENPENMLMASMLKDIERGSNIEMEAIIGDLIRHTQVPENCLMLNLVYTHLKAYLIRQEREKI